MSVLQALLALFIITAVWCTDPKVVVRQTFPYTTMVNNYKTIVTHKDKDAYMACVVDNKPGDKKVQWLAQNFNSETNIPISTDTDTQNAYKYQIDKPAANNWRLKVQNVQESDNALYICRVQLGGQQSANDSRILIVVQKPQIIDIYTSSDSTVEEDDRVVLECAAGGIPTPRISWQMRGGGVLPTGGRVLQQPKLVIPAAHAEHKGAYICTAENSAGKDQRKIYLNVKFYPRLTASTPEIYQAVGYGRDLQCEAKGNPVPGPGQLLWYKEGVPLADTNKYKFENYTGSNFVLMKMRIDPIEEGDFGEYGCYAENSEGSGENFVRLMRSFEPVDERTGKSGTAIISFSLITLVMIVSTSLLHFC